MQRDDKQAVLGCAVAFLFVAGAIASFFVWSRINFNRVQAEIDRHYQTRPILREMKEARIASSDADLASRKVLLEHVPIGSEKTRVTNVLGQAGFWCQERAAPPKNSFAANLLRQAEKMHGRQPPQDIEVNCLTDAPAQSGKTRWVISLQFDPSARLAAAVVSAAQAK
jgi:hypothetical protein